MVNTILLVATYNQGRLLPTFFSYVYKLNPQPERTVFAENNSTDNTLEHIKSFKRRKELIRLWFRRDAVMACRNRYEIIGIVRQFLLTRARQLDPDYAIFLDSDVFPLDSRLIEKLTGHGKDVVGGPYLRRFPWGLYLATVWRDPSGKLRAWNISPSSFEEVELQSAGCMCLSRRIIQDRRVNFYPMWSETASEDFGYCLLPHQYVHTDTLPTMIQNVRINQEVLTGRGTYRKVTKCFKRWYEGIIIRIKPRHEIPIYLTIEHPIFVSRNYKLKKTVNWGDRKIQCGSIKSLWVKAGDVMENDMLFFPKPRFDMRRGQYKVNCDLFNKVSGPKPNLLPKNLVIDEKIAYLLGLFLSEGYISRQPTLTFNYEEQSVINEAEEILANMGFNVRHKLSTGYQLVVSSKAFGRFLRLLGGKSRVKQLPFFWNYMRERELCSLIKGYFQGDATLHPPSNKRLVQAKTESQILGRQIHLALIKLGIYNCINQYRSYILVTVPTKYQEIFFKKIFGKDVKMGKIRGSRIRIRERQRGYWVKIKRLDRIFYRGPVYNLSVESPYTYNCEGITVHNCRKAKLYGYKVWLDGTVKLRHVLKGRRVKPWSMKNGKYVPFYFN